MSFEASLSSAAATVTVCPVFQFEVVKESEVWLPVWVAFVSTVTSVLLLDRLTETLPVGFVASATVKVAVEPSVTPSEVGFSVSPCSSSSVTLTDRVEFETLP